MAVRRSISHSLTSLAHTHTHAPTLSLAPSLPRSLTLSLTSSRFLQDGRTPLYYAARFGNVGACKALLSGGAKNIAANFGKTPLQRAEEEGHADVVQLLKGSLGIKVLPAPWWPRSPLAAPAHPM